MKTKQLFRLFNVFLAIIMLLGIAPTVFAAEYNDIADSAWYRTAVDYVSEHNLMGGTGNNNFEPDTPLSRAMLVTILHRIEGALAVNGTGSFTDVPVNSYYTTAVSWAVQNNIVEGVGSGSFAPQNQITREQFATILYRYANSKGYDTSASVDLNGYSDTAHISSYAQPALHWAVGNQLLQGSDNRLTPLGSTTRAQAASVLMRFMENMVPDTSVAPTEPIQPQPTEPVATGELRMRITVGDTVLTATLADNETARAFANMLPLTLPMMDLYGREMCYRFADELPANDVQTRNFQLGEIIYWPPRHSFVIMYKQDGAQFDMQHVGQIDSGVEIFNQTGDVQATFELLVE